MKRNTILPFLLLFVSHFAWFSAIAQEDPSYKNRIGINLLGLPAQNLVGSYEYSFIKNGLWLGIEHKLNQPSDDQDQQLNSLALEYRFYLFAKDKAADGLFAGLYTKYRWGEERTTTGASVQHEYQAVFSGLNTGYRYNYKRLALSAFVGYGLPLWSTGSMNPSGATHELNENYKKNLRLGITVGLAFL